MDQPTTIYSDESLEHYRKLASASAVLTPTWEQNILRICNSHLRMSKLFSETRAKLDRIKADRVDMQERLDRLHNVISLLNDENKKLKEALDGQSQAVSSSNS